MEPKTQNDKESLRKQVALRLQNAIETILKTKSQKKSWLASELDIRETTLNNYLAGRNEMSYMVLESLFKKFKINLNWLITGTENMFLELPRVQNKSYLIGDKIKKLRELLSLSPSEFVKLSPIASQLELLSIEDNRLEVEEPKIIEICKIFCVRQEWLIGNEEKIFNTKNISFQTDLDFIESQFPVFRPYKLFVTACEDENKPLYFTLWMIHKNYGKYSGIVYYDLYNYAVWNMQDINYEICKFKHFLLKMQKIGFYTGSIDISLYEQLIKGSIHPATIKTSSAGIEHLLWENNIEEIENHEKLKGYKIYGLTRLFVEYLSKC